MRFADPSDGSSGGRPDRDANRRLQDLARVLLSDPAPGITDVVPGYVTLYVEYDLRRTGEGQVRRWVEAGLEALDDLARGGGGGPALGGGESVPPSPDGEAVPSVWASGGPAGGRAAAREVEIPVRYDGEDLEAVAAATGLTVDRVVALHSSERYHVYAVGFSAGFPFLGEVPRELRVARLARPRGRVPAHSVALAGAQTGIYPLSSPGGWRLIGTALEGVYDPHREEPFLLEPGDEVRFVPAAGDTPADPVPVPLLEAEPERPALLVREPGLLDIVVDEGRFMVGRFGLARGGPLDARSARLANALLGNSPTAPLLELNIAGPVLEALAPVVVSLAGWGLRPVLNGVPVEPFASFGLRAGDVLSFRPSERGAGGPGCRAYLALAGGVAAASFAGSSSTDLRALVGKALAAGDVVGGARPGQVRPGRSFVPYRRCVEPVVLRLLPGPQYSREAMEALTAGPSRGVFEVTAADRVGLRLGGDEVPGGEVLSEGVPLGAVQVPPGGSPILLLNDRGTLGGYAKPAVVHPADLHLAGQVAAGSRVRFVLPAR